MEELLDDCRLLYLNLTSIDTKLFCCDTKRQHKDWASLKQNLRDVLCSLKRGQKFRHSIFDSLLHEKFIEQQPKWDYKLVAGAFGHLETYCRLLRTYPWKTEYHTLKTYGGFFQTYILSALPSCMMILKIIGYSPISPGAAETTLRLNSVPNVALLETIGFDCLAASVECELRLESMNLMSNKLSNLQLDEIMARRIVPDKMKKKHLPFLTVADRGREKVSSLPRELEPYPRYKTPHGDLMRSVAKSRTYHFEKLDLHEKRRNMFTDLVMDQDDSSCRGVNFSSKVLAYNPGHGHVNTTTTDENPTN